MVKRIDDVREKKHEPSTRSNFVVKLWGFIPANMIERVHLQSCKIFGVKKSSQNDFVYGEFCRTSLLAT